ncbi:MAG: NosD domain-containing protein [Gemmatimonadaceae bacterium]
MKRILSLLLAWQAAAAQPAVPRNVAPPPTIELRRGLVITSSVRVLRRAYSLPASPSLDSAVIVIRGDDITVDFNGAELRGTSRSALPDEAAGVAIRIDGGRNVRVLHARVHGYRVGLMAAGTRGLDLVDNDLSYNWKPRLFSVVEHESLIDWMSFHKNEQREWLRFGAGIYLDDVIGGELRGNRVEQSINGIMLVRSDSLRIHDNTLSFNSGLGLALYRSSNNTIVNNRIEYDVRGYSHGFFRRGQDSAGLLMYEQSSNNTVAWNTVTHGGDGLFLWAGQSTMDTGEGGANDNLFLGNDFSFAPTNGMEATFSRNQFVGNRVEGSDHGLWGGYSFDSRIFGNCFARNRIAIAIEHGQDNLIDGNRFDGDSTGISLWANAIEPSDWGYPKHRDTKSRDYRIRKNQFTSVTQPLKILNTTNVDTATYRDAVVGTGACDQTAMLAGFAEPLAQALPNIRHALPASTIARLDRSAIVVDEWGPFDWRSPKLWPIDSTRAVPVRLRVLGPPGAWKLLSKVGVASVSAVSGRVGDTLVVTPLRADDWSVRLEYRGGATLSPSGERRAASVPYAFSYGRFEPLTDWQVKFFKWPDSSAKTLSTADFDALRQRAPFLVRRESRLDYMWYRPGIKELPQMHWAAEATTSITLGPGVYTLRTISDDAIRVWVDGVLVVDNWAPHESMVDNARLSGGRHDIRVAYGQVDGWSELRVEVLRGAHRSTGSAGPH